MVSPLTRLGIFFQLDPGLAPRAKFIPPLRGWYVQVSNGYSTPDLKGRSEPNL